MLSGSSWDVLLDYKKAGAPQKSDSAEKKYTGNIMKDIEQDCQVTSDVVSVQDWTIDADQLLTTLAKDTAQLIEGVKKHFLKIGKTRRRILSLAEEAKESRQAQLFFKQNFSPALRKDLEKGCKFWDYTQQLDEMEDDIDFILSNTGFDVANALIGKLPDTLSKVEFPGVLENPIAKKIEVASNIVTELVETTLKEKEGVDKGIKSSDVVKLIKLNSVPDCDRVEFKEAHTTYRAEVIEYCPDADVLKVKIDGSGQEKEIPRGTVALKEQKAPKLHEPCLIQGDESEHYNKCGIFKAIISDDKALVLLLDGNLIEVPKKQLVKGKKGSPIPELLYLLDESGNADKVTLAVEKAVEKTTKTFQKQIDELTTEVGKAYADGRISVAVEAREMQPKIPLDVFLGIPVQEKLEIFKAQPEEAKNLILANYVKSLPIKNVDCQIIEVATPVAEPVVVDMTRFAKKDLTETLPVAPTPLSLEEQIKEAEEEYTKASAALEAKERELGVEPDSHLKNYVIKKQCAVEIKAKNNADTKRCRLKLDLKELNKPIIQEPEPTKSEMVFSKEDVAKVEDLLLKGYRRIEDGSKVQTTVKELSIEFFQVADYLASVSGKEWLCLYYLKNAADVQFIVRSVIPDQKEADTIVDRAINCMEKLGKIAGYYQEANFLALETVDTRLKTLAKLLLTEKEIAKFTAAEENKAVTSKVEISKPKFESKVNIKSKATQVAATFADKDDPVNSCYTKETIREWLCDSSSIKNGIAYLETNGIPLTDTFSASELQAMYDAGGQKQVSAIALVDLFKCKNLIDGELTANFGSKNQKFSSPKPRQLPPKVEPTEEAEEIPGGF